MTSPSASFLMPVYNDAECVQSAIDSVLSQTDSEFQFVIVDDASDSETRKILKASEKRDKRIILIRNTQNMGITKSLNIGVKKCAGEIIIRIDSDDRCIPERLSLIKECFTKNPQIDVIYSSYFLLSKYGEVGGIFQALSPFWTKRFMKWLNLIAHPTIAVRKKTLVDAGLYDETVKSGQDWVLWNKLFANKVKFHRVKTPLVYVCRAMRAYRNPNINQYQWAFDKYLSLNNNKIPHERRATYSRRQNLILALYGLCPRLIYYALIYMMRAAKKSAY